LKACNQTIARVVLLLFASGVGTQAALQQQTQPPATNPQQSNQTPAKRDDAKPPQKAPSTPGSTSAQQQRSTGAKAKITEDQKSEEQASGISKDRLFWTLPNFLTVENASQFPPLTTGQKFKVVARSTFDPVEFAYIGFVAAIGQASNSQPAFGQGWGAYGERYATSFGDNMIENFMVGAIFPSILRQDPRYYQLGKGSFTHRTGYAIGRIFITRSDSGHKQFNYSEILGSAVAAGISTYSYHPRSDQNVSNAMSVWGTQVGWDVVSTVVKEFWPDIRRKFHKENQQP
jgi:hypothetical protein